MSARLLPPALPPNGTLGIVAPCSPVREEALERGREALHALGFKTVVGEAVLERHGHHAGSVEAILADLHRMFARRDVDAVLCARGGSGSICLLDRLDWDHLSAHPKPFLGFSDVTSLHLAFARKTGLVTYFAPMVTSDFAQPMSVESLDVFRRLITQPEPLGEYYDPRCAEAATLVAGVAEGPLVGGTLSLIAASMGTPYEIETEGAILFMEDIYESPAHIERFLVQLELAGKLQQAKGFLVGSLRWDPDEEERSRYLSFEQVLEERLVPLGKPVLTGWPSGHLPSPLALPLGVRARLDTAGKSLTLLEPTVR